MKTITVLFAVLLGVATADDCHVGATDVWFGDIYAWMSPSFDACKERCRTDGRCRGVVYYHWGVLTGKCFLKNGGHGGRISCAWCTSAFKPCIDQEGPCTAGQYKASRLSCANCPSNTYSGAGASRCTACPAGQYSGTRQSSCSSCPAGTARPSGGSKCTACPANTYSGAGASGCNACPAGQYSGPGKSSCSSCPAGTARPSGGSTCTACPANTYSGAGATECKPCGDGYTSPKGSTSADNCKSKNGAHCWELYDNVRLTGIYGEGRTYEKANPACYEDDSCTGVTCRRRRGADECFLGAGTEHETDKNKWYIYLKEC